MTARLRPDLIAAARAAGRLSKADERSLETLRYNQRLFDPLPGRGLHRSPSVSIPPIA